MEAGRHYRTVGFYFWKNLGGPRLIASFCKQIATLGNKDTCFKSHKQADFGLEPMFPNFKFKSMCVYSLATDLQRDRTVRGWEAASDAELAELPELTNTKVEFPKAKLCWIPPSCHL